MAQAVACVPSTDVPLLTRATIGAAVLAVRPPPVPAEELRYGPPGVAGAVAQFRPSTVAVQQELDMRNFRYMWDPPERRREVINERVWRIGLLLRQQYGLPDYSRLTDVAQDEQVFLGIVQHCAQANGVVSCVVDGPQRPDVSYGAGATLRLEDVPSCTLYPGKVIAFRGKNLGGRPDGDATGPTILVSEIFETPPLPVAALSMPTPMEEDGEVVSRMAVVSGPYSNDQVHTIQLIEEVVTFAARQRHASCVVLCGPFVPAPPADAPVDEIMMYDEQFDAIGERFTALAHRFPGLQLVVVPSLRDMAAECVFPQPPFDVAFDSEAVHNPGNPGRFVLNGHVAVAVSTNPILEHLARTMVEVRPDGQVGRIPRMAQQLLQARSLYPLMPPAPDAQLSLDHSGHCELTGATPDVLVLPSCLLPSAHRVGDALVVNPGFVQKRSFAEVTIGPPSAGKTVAERSVVEFFKLP